MLLFYIERWLKTIHYNLVCSLRKAYANKKRQKCVVEGEKQCEKCAYFEICADIKESNNEV